MIICAKWFSVLLQRFTSIPWRLIYLKAYEFKEISFFVGHLCLQVMAAIGTHPAYIKVLDLSQLCIFLHVNTFSQICMYAGYQCLL
jgi:hypothetical protein